MLVNRNVRALVEANEYKCSLGKPSLLLIPFGFVTPYTRSVLTGASGPTTLYTNSGCTTSTPLLILCVPQRTVQRATVVDLSLHTHYYRDSPLLQRNDLGVLSLRKSNLVTRNINFDRTTTVVKRERNLRALFFFIQDPTSSCVRIYSLWCSGCLGDTKV